MNCAAAIDRIRDLVAEALPPDVADAVVVIGHPGIQEDYAFALSLFALQLRDDASWRTARTNPVDRAPLEVDLLIASHAPPERWYDGIRLLEAACDVVRANPRFEGALSHTMAEVQLRPAPVAEVAGVWQALGTPMQPSVLCTVRVAMAPVTPDAR